MKMARNYAERFIHMISSIKLFNENSIVQNSSKPDEADETWLERHEIYER